MTDSLAQVIERDSGIVCVTEGATSCGDHGATLPANYVLIPGPEGPQGPPGIEGRAGAAGATGKDGQNGQQGPTGPASTVPGPQGPQGPPGRDSTVPGPQGPPGTNGTNGTNGRDGAQGPAGPLTTGDHIQISDANGTSIAAYFGNFLQLSGGQVEYLTIGKRLSADITVFDNNPIFNLYTREKNFTPQNNDGVFFLPHVDVHIMESARGHRELQHGEIHSYDGQVSHFIVGCNYTAWGHTGSGNLCGGNFVAIVEGGCAGSIEMAGIEANTVAKANVARKVGLQVIDVDGSGGLGTAVDAGVLVGKGTQAFGYLYGIQIGAQGDANQYPVRAAIMFSDVGTCERGLDLRATNVTSGHAVLLRTGTYLGWSPDTTYSGSAAGGMRSDASSFGMFQIFADYKTAWQDKSGHSFLIIEQDQTSVSPGGDGSITLGRAQLRWSTVFAVTGSINTSDERQKDVLGAPDDALLDAIGEIEPLIYQFKASVAEKGDRGARLHAGIVAQALQAALIKQGLEPWKYALWCEDPDVEQVVEEYTEQEPVLVDEEYTMQEIVVGDDGRAVMTDVTKTRQVPQYESIPVFNPDGSPNIVPARAARSVLGPDGQIARDEDGNPIIKPAEPERPRTFGRQVMQTVTKTRTVDRYKLDEDGNARTIYGVRYDELNVLFHAWTRRELARLRAAIAA